MSPKTTSEIVSEVTLPVQPVQTAVMENVWPFAYGVGLRRAFQVASGAFHGFQPACDLWGLCVCVGGGVERVSE